MIFVDANIPMYLVGAAHPNKTAAQIILERLIASGARLVTDAEVIQEILHRYAALGRRDGIDLAIRALLGVVDEVLPIEGRDALRAAEMVTGNNWLSARDALHLAVMERHRIDEILTFDADFERWTGVRRIARV